MTKDTSADGGSNRPTDEAGDARDGRSTGDGVTRCSLGTSRRSFLRAAGAGAGALALGTPTVASADDHDGELPQLYVEGSQIVDAAGEEVPLRGVAVLDPKELDVTAPARGKDASQALDLLTDAERGWHPTVVRLVVKPLNIGEKAPMDEEDAARPMAEPVAFDREQVEDYVETHLDPVIDQLADAGVYAIVDFQREDGLGEFEWNEPEIGTEIERFWEVVAPRYADRNHVLYELYGLPTSPGVYGDPTDESWAAENWYEWKETAQPWVDLIREHAPETVVIVGTPGYNQSPDGALVEPFEGANLAYAYHNYPGFPVSEEEAWGEEGPDSGGTLGVAEDVPVFVTEFGWHGGDSADNSTSAGTTSGYGEPFVEWMESQPGVYWTAYVASPDSFSAMFSTPFTDLAAADLLEIDPYRESVPEECPERPCEWNLLGEDEGDYDDYMGGFVKETLAELQSDVTLTEPEATRPSPPATVTVEGTSDSMLTVSWAAVDGAADYQLSVDGEVVQTVAATEATVTDLRPATNYRVGVATDDADGVASAPYTIGAETDEPLAEAPPAPENLDLEALSDGGVSATWDAVDGAGSYAVYLDGEFVEETTATEATLATADRATGPTVAVSSVGSAGESASSESTWTPLTDRVAHLDITTSDTNVAPGDQIQADVSLSDAHASFTGLDYRFEVDPHDDGRPAVIRDVDVTSDLGSVTVEEIGDDGAVSLEVSHRDGSLEDASSSTHLASFTIEGLSEERVTLGASDVRVHYDLVDEPASASVTTGTFYVEYDSDDFEDVDLGTELTVEPGSVEAGETLEATYSIEQVPEQLSGIDFTVATDADGRGDPPLEILDVEHANEFGTFTVSGTSESGTTFVEVELRDGALADVSGPFEIATVTLEAVADGTATVAVGAPAVRYEPIGPSIEATSASATVDVGTEPALPPTGIVDVEERTASTVELSWLEVADASEYAVYATEYEVTSAPADEISPLTPPSADALVERTTDTSATIDGLDALESYEVGVVALDDGATSPIASRPVTTASETTSEVVPEIGVDVDAEVIDEPDSTEASIVLSDPPADVAGYVVEVRVADPSVATLEDLEFGSTFPLSQVRARDDDGEWATLEGLDAGGALEEEVDAVDLASVTLDAGVPGSTDVVVTAKPLTLSSASSVDVATQFARLSVDVDNWNGTMQAGGVVYEPNDADGDGIYRDVNGDGSVTNSDVTLFFQNQHTDVVQNNEALFDFTGSGEVGQADVIALFRDVAGN